MSKDISAKKIMSSLAWVYLENITAQAVNFVVNVVLARILEPGYYGAIALVTVFINLANVFISSSFSYALVQKPNADELDYNTMFWFNLAASTVLYLALFAASPLIATYYRNPELSLILKVLAVRLPLSAFNSIQIAYISNRMVFHKSFVTNGGAALCSGIIGIFCAVSGMGIWSLVAQSLSHIVCSSVLMTIVVEWRPKAQFSFWRLRTMAGFGWKLLVTGLMFAGYAELRTLVIGKRYSADDLGYYERGNSFPRLIATNIDTTITRVLFPALSKAQDDPSALTALTRRAAKTSAFIMTPLLFGLACVAEPVVKILLTEKWLPCVPYLQVMCVVWWLQPTQSCSIQAIKAIGRSDLYLYIELISKAVGIVLLILAMTYVDTPLSIALSMLVGQAAAAFIYGAFVSRYIKYKLALQLWDLLVPGALSAAMCVGVLFLQALPLPAFVRLAFQIFVGMAIYVLLAHLLKVEEFQYLTRLFFKRSANPKSGNGRKQ